MTSLDPTTEKPHPPMPISATQKLRVYARLWAIHRILYFNPGGWGAGSGLSDHLKFIEGIALLVTFVSGQGMCLSIFLHFFVNFWVKLPFVWDSEWLCFQTDLAYLLFTLYHSYCAKSSGEFDERRWNDIRRAIRTILIWFYVSAGFLKVNTSFLTPSTSCAAIFPAQILTYYLPPQWLPHLPAKLIADTAPTLTLVVEHSIPLIWWFFTEEDIWWISATPTALVFHALIAFCPPPHNIGTFSVLCASRIFCFHDDELTKAVYQPLNFSDKNTLGGLVVAAFVVWRSYVLGSAFPSRDKSIPVYTSIMCLYVRAYCLRGRPSTKSVKVMRENTKGLLILHRSFVAGALWYAIVLPTLGWMEQGSANMFANLRVHGGTNHLVLPIGFLTPYLSGGAYVRVEDASPTFAPELPGELSPYLTGDCVDFLKKGNHTAKVFNPAVGKVVGRFVLPQTDFTRYTIPLNELRRYHAIAVEENIAFSYQYSLLEGFYGDERWRRESSVQRLRVSRAGPNKEVKCDVEIIGKKPKWRPCTSDETLSPPHPVIAKLVNQMAYPILEGEWDELHCFGP